MISKGSFFFILGIIVILFIHHAFTHNGNFFDTVDFENALANLAKSHEGMIIFMVLLLSGAVIFC